MCNAIANAMAKTSVVIMMLASGPVSGHGVRHSTVPQTLQGIWSPAGACGGAEEAIVLEAKSYKTAAESCTVDYVSETPGRQGPIFSARLLCEGAQAQGGRSSARDLIIRADGTGRISLGATFADLAPYQLCGTNGAASAR